MPAIRRSGYDADGVLICMHAKASIRWLRATAVASSVLAAGALGAACESLLHDGQEVQRKECATCHLPDYKAAKQPVHVGAFPTGCGDCHSEEAWSPTHGFDHGERFPLRGAHAKVVCADCHTRGFGPGDTPDTCVGCHRDDYEAARMPAHAGFSTRCNTCHDESGWKPAKFDHSWPLTGAHATAPCTGCHGGKPPVYEGTSKECVSCHRDDYERSPFPGHATFPTTCQQCHATKAWTPATGGTHPEARFPIKNGAHSEFECMSCHNEALGPNGKDNTDCVGCHTGEHSRSKMDEKHHEVAKYPTGAASPRFCLDCHPDGDE